MAQDTQRARGRRAQTQPQRIVTNKELLNLLFSRRTARRLFRRMMRSNAALIVCGVLMVVVAVGAYRWYSAHAQSSASTPAQIQAKAKAAAVWSDTLTNAHVRVAALAPMDDEINRFLARNGVVGMSLAVSRNGRLVYAQGYGMADVEGGKPMEANTIMRIASSSKLITATAIMKLVEDGRLRLDQHVFGADGVLSDRAFTEALGDKRMLDITVDHLLQHRGGFTLGAGDPMFSTRDILKRHNTTKAPAPAQLAQWVLGRRLGFMPGSSRRYSNFGYLLLSLVIEKASGQSYWDYVTEQVLTPAGASHMRPATNYLKDRLPNEARYYGPDTVLIEEFNGSGRLVPRVYGGNDVHGLMGAGGWLASAADLLRLADAVDGRGGVKDVLSSKSVGIMTEYNTDKQCRGWTNVEADGRRSRTGTLSSTHSLVMQFPDGESWCLVTNSGHWRGHRFGRQLEQLVNTLRSRYSAALPQRNLW